MAREKKYVIPYRPFGLRDYGEYTSGVSSDEINEYLKTRAKFYNNFKDVDIKKIRKQFSKTAGCNTCPVGPNGESLMYRHDVERFADKLFDNTLTYWD